MNNPISEAIASSLPKLDPLDSRLNVYRPDLADVRLRGKVDASNFVDGVTGIVQVPIANMKASMNENADTEHQLLMGEEVRVFEDSNNVKWVQSKLDRYVGYVDSQAIKTSDNNVTSKQPRSSHVVRVPRTFCYPKPELRNPPISSLSMGSRVTVAGYQTVRGTKYALLSGGNSIIEKHLRLIDNHAKDYVEICQLMLHTPYLWGGSSGFGIDCSSLIQLSMRMCGRQVLRDSDMQAATLGKEIEPGANLENLQRGDLIFWRGHAAIHKGPVHGIPHIIHSSGHTMSVAAEPLHEAIGRIGYLYEQPIGFRRP